MVPLGYLCYDLLGVEGCIGVTLLSCLGQRFRHFFGPHNWVFFRAPPTHGEI